MKALVTGSAGFIGSAFMEFLQDRGYEVEGIDTRDALNPRCAIQEFGQRSERYDLIVHAAYLVGGRASIDGLNLNMAQNLSLDAAAFNYAVKTGSRLLYFSSSAAYPIRLQDGAIPHALRESDIDLNGVRSFLPDAHYGWAKITGERLAEQARLMGADVHVVRPFSGYGENQTEDYPFMSILGRMVDGDYSVWGPPEQTRDWIHIDDVIMGCWRIIEGNVQTPINLCTGRPVTMAQLMKLGHKEWGNSWELQTSDIEFQLDKPTGVMYRVGNPSKFFDIHRPSVSLREGVRRALATF